MKTDMKIKLVFMSMFKELCDGTIVAHEIYYLFSHHKDFNVERQRWTDAGVDNAFIGGIIASIRLTMQQYICRNLGERWKEDKRYF